MRMSRMRTPNTWIEAIEMGPFDRDFWGADGPPSTEQLIGRCIRAERARRRELRKQEERKKHESKIDPKTGKYDWEKYLK